MCKGRSRPRFGSSLSRNCDFRPCGDSALVLVLRTCPTLALSWGDYASVEHAAAQGQAWFDEVLVRKERSSLGGLIDGYLVLALPEPPEVDAREKIRRLELSSQVCRKHIIWPSTPADQAHEPGLWQRVADITVLGLPETSAPSSSELGWPELDSEAQALWAELSTLGVNGTVLLHERAPNARN